MVEQGEAPVEPHQEEDAQSGDDDDGHLPESTQVTLPFRFDGGVPRGRASRWSRGGCSDDTTPHNTSKTSFAATCRLSSRNQPMTILSALISPVRNLASLYGSLGKAGLSPSMMDAMNSPTAGEIMKP